MSKLIDPGDTAWTLVALCMALLITPGLICFYGGILKPKENANSYFQSYVSFFAVGLLWAICGYSLTYSGDYFGIIGDFDWAFLNGVSTVPHPDLAPTIPHLLHMMRQFLMAVLTPILMTAVIAPKAPLKSWVFFILSWSLIVYIPVAHWFWSPQGWLHQIGALDFAGGWVHMTAGVTALVFEFALGRESNPSPKAPVKKNRNLRYSIPSDLIPIGSVLLTIGCLGLTAGATLQANGLAAHAVTTTFLAAASSLCMWTFMDWILQKQSSLSGSTRATLLGLIVITSGAGYVTIPAAVFIGFFASGIYYFSNERLKNFFGIQDRSKIFTYHGLGGALGIVLTGIFSSKIINYSGEEGLLLGNFSILNSQLLAAISVIFYTASITFILIKSQYFLISRDSQND